MILGEFLVKKNPPAMQETLIRSLCGKDPLEEEMATYSSILAWEIPWTEEPGRLQSMVSPRVRHAAAAAAAKSLQSCPTLCDPIDGSPLDLATKPHKPRWFLGVPLSPLASSLSSTGLPRMTAPVRTKGLPGPESLRQVGVRSLFPVSPNEGDMIVAFHRAQFTYFSLVEPPSLPPQRERSLWV